MINPGFTWNSSRYLLEILPGIHPGFLPGFTLNSPGVPPRIHPEFLPGLPGIPPGIPPLIHPKFRFSISEIPSGIHLGFFKGTIRDISHGFIRYSFRYLFAIPLELHPGCPKGFNLEFSQDSPGIRFKIYSILLQGFLSRFILNSFWGSPGIPPLLHPGFLPEFPRDSSRASFGIPSVIHPVFFLGFTQDSPAILSGILPEFNRDSSR